MSTENNSELYNQQGQSQLALFSFATASPPAPQFSEASVLSVYRVQLVQEDRLQRPSVQFRSSFDAATLLQDYLHDADREYFVALLLNRKNRFIGINTVSIGSVTDSIVHPREVFKAAVLANATAIICGHNHVSGDTAPSQEDRTMTNRLVECGKIMGIGILDHVIVGYGNTEFYSFADNNCLAL